MESRLRMLIVLAGLPEPRVNLKLRQENGEWWMRFDLCYEGCRLVVEYDGVQHRDDEAQRLHDIKRREELDRLRYRVVIVTSQAGVVCHRNLDNAP